MFDKHTWVLPREILPLIGECDALIYTLKNAPLTPEVFEELKKKSLKRGALATTAIEGNSITEEEFDKYIARKKTMPPSRQYQKVEIENVLNAFAAVENIPPDQPLNCALIKRLHSLIMAEKPEAVPGQFRPGNVVVGTYRPPDYQKVPALIEKYCQWLQAFKFPSHISLLETLPVALAAHVFFELIHPFSDGNGRLGRMIEYCLLLRAGLPLTAGHILSNYYNQTRDNYYKYLAGIDYQNPDRGLLDFMVYAIQGLCDGLYEALDLVRENQKKVFWQRLVYDRFSGKDEQLDRSDKKRRRSVVLNFPLEDETGLVLEEIPVMTKTLEYGDLPKGTLNQDLAYLEHLGLIRKVGEKYYANYDLVCPGCQILPKES